MKISDEVIDRMRKAYSTSNSATIRDFMRAAADVLVPVVLAEALKSPTDAEVDTVRGCQGALSFGAMRTMLHIAFHERHQALLTPSADPAVEAVESVLREVRWVQGGNPSSRTETLQAIVAAVRAADQKAGQQ